MLICKILLFITLKYIWRKCLFGLCVQLHFLRAKNSCFRYPLKKHYFNANKKLNIWTSLQRMTRVTTTYFFCYLCIFSLSLVFGSLSVLVLEIYCLHYQKVITAFRSLVVHKWDMWRTNIHSKCLKTKSSCKYLHLSRMNYVQHYTLMKCIT
jgi:hypothetical protein